MIRPALMIGLGEVLWDILPTGRVLGGAPTNFAYMTNVLGDQGIVASRAGNDELGREACQLLQKLGLKISYLQRDDLHETGIATVTIDGTGQPNFTIKEPVAWDFLELTADWEELSARADVICFGTLAQRSLTSAATIDRFLRNTSAKALRICDVNFRQSFYNENVLRKSFQYADIVKLNEQELTQVSFLFNLGAGTAEVIARRLLQNCDLKLVCITRADRAVCWCHESKRLSTAGSRSRWLTLLALGTHSRRVLRITTFAEIHCSKSVKRQIALRLGWPLREVLLRRLRQASCRRF